jgi:hypothetical protein
MPRPLDDDERRMPFVEVTDVDFEPERFQQTPFADAEHDRLHQPRLRPAAIERARQPAIRRCVQRVIAVEEIQHCPPDRDLPDSQQNRPAREIQRHVQALTPGSDDRLGRQARRFVVGIQLLPACRRR